MNRSQLISEIATKTEQTKKLVQEIVTVFTTVVQQSLKKGDDVRLAGFGKFYARSLPARLMRNPKTAEKIKVPAMRRARFRPSKGWKYAPLRGTAASKSKS